MENIILIPVNKKIEMIVNKHSKNITSSKGVDWTIAYSCDNVVCLNNAPGFLLVADGPSWFGMWIEQKGSKFEFVIKK